MSKYTVYIADWCDEPTSKKVIGSADTVQECRLLLKKYIEENQLYSTPYWRYLLGPITTFIDFGISGKYGAIQPPLASSDL